MNITVDETLWATALLPEGIFERWLVEDGRMVKVGDALAEVRIEDARHEIIAPAAGRLSTAAKTDQVVEPGAIIGSIA